MLSGFGITFAPAAILCIPSQKLLLVG